jgi:hypothetical protein
MYRFKSRINCLYLRGLQQTFLYPHPGYPTRFSPGLHLFQRHLYLRYLQVLSERKQDNLNSFGPSIIIVDYWQCAGSRHSPSRAMAILEWQVRGTTPWDPQHPPLGNWTLEGNLLHTSICWANRGVIKALINL